MAKEAHFLSVKYLTGLLQSLAVLTLPGDVSTARLCPNPVKYFTVKKCASLAIISQNPGFIEIQVLELVYMQTVHVPLYMTYICCMYLCPVYFKNL